MTQNKYMITSTECELETKTSHQKHSPSWSQRLYVIKSNCHNRNFVGGQPSLWRTVVDVHLYVLMHFHKEASNNYKLILNPWSVCSLYTTFHKSKYKLSAIRKVCRRYNTKWKVKQEKPSYTENIFHKS